MVALQLGHRDQKLIHTRVWQPSGVIAVLPYPERIASASWLPVAKAHQRSLSGASLDTV